MSTPRARLHRAVWIKTLLLAASLAIVVILVHARLISPYVSTDWLAWAAALVAVQATVLATLMLTLIGIKAVRHSLAQRVERVLPTIQEALAEHATGSDRSRRLDELHRGAPRAFDDGLAGMIKSLAGESRERLVALAIAMGLVSRWVRDSGSRRSARRLRAVGRLGVVDTPESRAALEAALEDDVQTVRIFAAQGLIASGAPGIVARVFRSALDQPLLVRAVLAPDLAAHAEMLCAGTVPEVLADGSVQQVCAALDIVRSWRVSCTLYGFGALLEDPRAAVRARALRLAPYVTDGTDHEDAVVASLRSTDDAIVAGACHAIAGLGIRRATARLDEILRTRPPQQALSAAYALAALGEDALLRLEGATLDAGPPAADLAFEALTLARTGRLTGRSA